LNKKLEFLKEEVEIRVQSLKDELDVLSDSLISKLNDEVNNNWFVNDLFFL
jgi:hypothetical protein